MDIFLSYRRTDAAGYAQALRKDLEQHFKVFQDVKGIDPGYPWPDVLSAAVQKCQVLVVVIGPEWLKARDEESGERRLDQEEDWVRREILTALTRTPRPTILSVLVGGATFPKKNHLPKLLQPLADIQHAEIRYEHDLAPLIAAIQKALAKDRQHDCSAYLQQLGEQCSHIDLKGIQEGQAKASRLPMGRLYMPLTTSNERERVPLQESLRDPRLVLVGDPGAGKSTFLKRILHAACTGESAFLSLDPIPLPFLIPAASLSNFIHLPHPPLADSDSPKWIPRYLKSKSDEMDWGLPPHFIDTKLKQGCLLLIDGLDEAPDRVRREELARLLENASTVYREARIVVTTRPTAYGGKTELTGYSTARIEPLDDNAIATFTANWYGCLYPDRPTEAEAQTVALNAAIGGRSEIQEMARNPLMLTALAMLHWSNTRLPDQRAELYEAILKWLARARERSGRASADLCLDRMQHLAYRMHDAGKHKEVDPHDAADFLQDQFRDVPAGIERIRAAERFLVQEETDSGILVSRNQTLQFWHRSFQEYLAAKALSNLEDERPRLLFGPGGKLYEGEWRETTLLLAFLLRQQNAARIDAFLKRMLDEAESGGLLEHARCAGRIGSFLRDLRVWKYQITDERFMQYMNESLVLLSDTKAVRSVDFQTRLEVADAWGLMGDPRLAEDRKWVDVGPFRMGRYPVTVQEYAEYVRAGGTAPDNWTQQLQYPNRPVVYVDWEQASGYCRSVGGRLPTSAEWELAARCGRKGDIYPWGKAETDEYKANTWETGPHHATPVGMYPEGATPSGLLDMAGNVWEWCEDWYDSDKNSKTLRGGSWNYVTRGSRVSYRSRVVPTVRDISLGFRCIGE